MKQFIEKFKTRALWLLVTIIALIITLNYATAGGPTTIGVLSGASTPVINSSLGNSNNANWGAVQPNGTFATNGYYPCYIPGQTTVSNYVLLNGSLTSGNDLIVSVVTSTGGSGSLTNATIALYTSLGPITLLANSVGDLYPSTNTPLTYLTTITAPITNGISMSTNLVLNPYTTPAWNGALRLYAGSIAFNGATAASLTNYFIYATQN